MPDDDKTYRDRVIRLCELVDDRFSPLEGFTFIGCQVKGPAVIVLEGGTLASSDLGGPPDAILWEIQPSRPMVVGAVLARNCVFEGCTFEGVGFAGPPDKIAAIRNSMGG